VAHYFLLSIILKGKIGGKNMEETKDVEKKGRLKRSKRNYINSTGNNNIGNINISGGNVKCT
jgi:hypothetical protein